MKKRAVFFLLLAGAVLLSLPFYRSFSGIVLFIAWVPLLFVEDHFTQHKDRYRSGRVFLLFWFTFLVWTLLTIYWIWYATILWAFIAFILISLAMAVTFWLIHVIHRNLGDKMGYLAFLVVWIAYEHLHLNLLISLPWLNLGNGFAKDIALIQWYEYTGTLGGTFWVLLVNLLIFRILRHYIQTYSLRTKRFELALLIFILVLPISWSLIRYHTIREKGEAVEVVVVQPNIDPYKKFSGISNQEQLSIILRLADSLVTPHTAYVVAPETAVNDSILENDPLQSRSIRRIKAFVRKHPHVKFVTGGTTWQRYPAGPRPTPTSRLRTDSTWKDIFNAAIEIDTSGNIQFYHKSRLVAGTETIPYPNLLRPLLGNYFIKLGGGWGGYGTQEKRSPLVSPDSTVRVGVIICYESIFGEYVTDYIKEGANLLFVITNDGWWGNSPGYFQHRTYASLRAIENRRSIARSANNGTSCFIDQKGKATLLTRWWTPTAIRGILHTNDQQSFYTRHGDYIGRVSDFFAIILILYVIAYRLMNRKKVRGS